MIENNPKQSFNAESFAPINSVLLRKQHHFTASFIQFGTKTTWIRMRIVSYIQSFFLAVQTNSNLLQFSPRSSRHDVSSDQSKQKRDSKAGGQRTARIAVEGLTHAAMSPFVAYFHSCERGFSYGDLARHCDKDVCFWAFRVFVGEFYDSLATWIGVFYR